MSDKVIPTLYRHTYGPDGKPLAKPCEGLLQVCIPNDGGQVFVCCGDCGQCWKFSQRWLSAREQCSGS
jgi:hypothetical protein